MATTQLQIVLHGNGNNVYHLSKVVSQTAGADVTMKTIRSIYDEHLGWDSNGHRLVDFMEIDEEQHLFDTFQCLNTGHLLSSEDYYHFPTVPTRFWSFHAHARQFDSFLHAATCKSWKEGTEFLWDCGDEPKVEIRIVLAKVTLVRSLPWGVGEYDDYNNLVEFSEELEPLKHLFDGGEIRQKLCTGEVKSLGQQEDDDDDEDDSSMAPVLVWEFHGNSPVANNTLKDLCDRAVENGWELCDKEEL